MSSIPRVATGVKGFDECIENGFPIGSIVLLAGNPGAGKTTFTSKFLYDGSTVLGEKGVYASFAETKKLFYTSMLRFGWDFERLDREGRCSILDLATTKQTGIQSNLDLILGEISRLKAKRLVIDSVTALTSALSDQIDVRHLIHLLYRFLKEINCTTIIISDIPYGSPSIGSGVEEFIADGIILMTTEYNEKRELERNLRILKMRGTNHSTKIHDYKITEHGVIVEK